VENKEHSGRPRAFEDDELQALVDEDLCQTQKQLTKALNYAQSVIFDRLQILERSTRKENGSHMN